MTFQYGEQNLSMVYQLNNMKKGTLLFLILLMIAMAGGLALVNKNQDTRKGATFANTTLSVIPSEKIIKNVNETVSTQLWFYTENDSAKVDGVQTVVCYGKELSLVESEIVVNTEAGFEQGPIVAINDSDSNKICATIVVTSKKTAADLVTTAKAMTLNFTAVSAGSGEIVIDKEKSMVTGDNSASATDKTLAITSVAGTTYEIKEAVLTGDEPILNYKVSFAYVKAESNKCLVNWPLQVIALGGGESKVYTNVIPSSKTEVEGKVVLQGSLPLVGFNQPSNVAVFIKGPQHLQMKYATQNQSAPYNQAGGVLTLTRLATSSTVYDFSNYPMLAGDIVSPDSESQDGWINGVDYSYIKTKADIHKTVAEGTNLKGDLDGNCQVNSNDVNELKISLEKKQEELY